MVKFIEVTRYSFLSFHHSCCVLVKLYGVEAVQPRAAHKLCSFIFHIAITYLDEVEMNENTEDREEQLETVKYAYQLQEVFC